MAANSPATQQLLAVKLGSSYVENYTQRLLLSNSYTHEQVPLIVNRDQEVVAKVQDWLGGGCQCVWVIDPRARTVFVYHGHNEPAVLSGSDQLDSGGLLPGLGLSVAEIFGG